MSLPAYPWLTRPEDLPLTADEVCAALAENNGDVTAASVRLKVGSLILRKFIERSSRAKAVVREMDARLGDKARSKLAEALDDPDNRRVDWAIRYVLNAKVNRALGYSASDAAEDQARNHFSGPVNVMLNPAQWEDGTTFGPPPAKAPPQIELHATSMPTVPEKTSE